MQSIIREVQTTFVDNMFIFAIIQAHIDMKTYENEQVFMHLVEFVF